MLPLPTKRNRNQRHFCHWARARTTASQKGDQFTVAGIHTALLPKQVLHKHIKKKGSYTSPLLYKQADNSPET